MLTILMFSLPASLAVWQSLAPREWGTTASSSACSKRTGHLTAGSHLQEGGRKRKKRRRKMKMK